MRPSPLALVLAVGLLLVAVPLADAQNDTATSENETAGNDTAGNETGQDPGNVTDGEDGGDGNTTVPPPERPDHVPWTAFALGGVLFAGSIYLARRS